MRAGACRLIRGGERRGKCGRKKEARKKKIRFRLNDTMEVLTSNNWLKSVWRFRREKKAAIVERARKSRARTQQLAERVQM